MTALIFHVALVYYQKSTGDTVSLETKGTIMNAREFLRALSGLKDKGWEAKLTSSHLDKQYVIQLKKKGERKTICPITAVCSHLRSGSFDVEDWGLASDAIGLSHRLAKIIVRAADDQLSSKEHRHMRKALLLALDL